jgi:hypothetical protein
MYDYKSEKSLDLLAWPNFLHLKTAIDFYSVYEYR